MKNGWKVAFWVFFALWLVQGAVIGILVGKVNHYQSVNNLLVSEQQQSSQTSANGPTAEQCNAARQEALIAPSVPSSTIPALLNECH